MSDNEIGNDSGPSDEVRDNIHQTSAAMKVRHILETAVMPRVAHMLNQTRKGEAIHACEHLVGLLGDGDDGPGPAGCLDWMCEGIGMMCQECAFEHLTDESTPHRDKRHAVCIVCGNEGNDGDDLHALGAKVEIRSPAVMTSDASDFVSELIEQRMGRGFLGTIALTPIAWECPAHDGFFESKIKLVWPNGNVIKKAVVIQEVKKVKKVKKGKRKREGKRRR